jgi:hypothetical protein
MRTKKNYRVTGRFKEIFDVLEKSKSSSGNHFWKMEKRDLHPIFIRKIDKSLNHVDIELRGPQPSPLKEGEEIYLKMETRDSAFKTRVLKLVGNIATLGFPDELVLSEARIETRHYFHPTEDKTVQIKRAKNPATGLPGSNITITVADISPSGIALILSQHQGVFFNVGDRILLDSLGTYRVHPPVEGEVVFKNAQTLKGVLGQTEKGSKIGIKFLTPLPKVTLEKFCLRDNTLSVDDEKIIKDHSFRKNVHDRLESMQKNLASKRSFKKVFAQIDMRKNEHHYLKTHIEMLAEVMCGLGSSLGWVSEATMDKLIYIAYLHDARYFSNPKLAKIQSKKEFVKNRKKYSDDDEKVFLEGPLYASELARSDTESYPDASKILLQQKELPDGTGFPYGITTSQFLPLSCLFIVSHYFVDYVLNNADWTLEDFVKTHEKFLKGNYFNKIFNFMR